MKSLSERSKKENEKLIDLLVELVGNEDKEIIVEVNSMKTAVAQKNKLGNLIGAVKALVWKNGWSIEQSEFESLMGNLCLNPVRLIDVYNQLCFKSNKRHYEVDERACVASVWFDVKDKESQQRYRKSICWDARQATQTSKRIVKDALSAMIEMIRKELGVSEYYEVKIPYIDSENYGTEAFYKKQLDALKSMHDGEWMSKQLMPCSDKQSIYIQKHLNVSLAQAQKLNKAQASEFLTAYWAEYEKSSCDNMIIEYYQELIKTL
jgi:hypothetical protein